MKKRKKNNGAPHHAINRITTSKSNQCCKHLASHIITNIHINRPLHKTISKTNASNESPSVYKQSDARIEAATRADQFLARNS